MESCSLYFHFPAYDAILSKVQTAFPKSTIQLSEEGDSRVIHIQSKGGLFSKKEALTIKYRQRQQLNYNLNGPDCPVLNQMRGMYNFLASLPATDPGLQSLLLAKIQTVNIEVSFVAEPKFSGDFKSLVTDVARSSEGFLFVQPGTTLSQPGPQQFLDKDLNLLIDTAGRCGNGKINVQIDASLMDDQREPSVDQLERKKKSEILLNEKGILLNKHLPFVDRESEVVLRTKEEIIERIYALSLIAAMGEGVAHEELEKAKNGLLINGLSPNETQLYSQDNLPEQEKVNCVWRYESMNLLMWSLGYVEPLTYPSTICDVPAIVGLVLQQSRQQFADRAVVKTTSEILDELDKIYRMHWACVEGRLKGIEPGGDLHPGIVYERHYALNWLTRQLDEEWDDITTGT